jgi:hypothetical protein
MVLTSEESEGFEAEEELEPAAEAAFRLTGRKVNDRNIAITQKTSFFILNDFINICFNYFYSGVSA